VTNAIVHNDRDMPRVTVTLKRGEGSALLRITDNGPGLPDAPVDDLIDPGFHGDEGLGLYLVDTLVTKYGGDLRFEDTQPGGTVVTVELPLADAGPA